MNIATLTAAIARLPDDTRHIVAGSMAFELTRGRVQNYRTDIKEIWAMSRPPCTFFTYPTTEVFRAALIALEVTEKVYTRLVARYDDYLPQPRRDAARRDNKRLDGNADAYRNSDDVPELSTYGLCAPPEML